MDGAVGEDREGRHGRNVTCSDDDEGEKRGEKKKGGVREE